MGAGAEQDFLPVCRGEKVRARDKQLGSQLQVQGSQRAMWGLTTGEMPAACHLQ